MVAGGFQRARHQFGMRLCVVVWCGGGWGGGSQLIQRLKYQFNQSCNKFMTGKEHGTTLCPFCLSSTMF